MFYLNVWLTVKDRADVETVRNLLSEAARNSRKEPGCSRFEVYHSTSDETKFLLNEHWESQAAIDAHRTGFAYTQIANQGAPWSTASPSLKPFIRRRVCLRAPSLRARVKGI